MAVRELAAKPAEAQTEREKYLYLVYATARDCVTGSMKELYTELGLTNVEFYQLLDIDAEFANALKCGMTDGRSSRLIELESALISLALGRVVTDKKVVESDEGVETTTTERHILPNLSAIQVLLERYQGSAWKVSSQVQVDASNTPTEIDYSILTPAQLKLLAKKGGNSQ